MNAVWEEEGFPPRGLYPLLIFSIGFHLLFLLFLGWFGRFSEPLPAPAETVVQLVDPPASDPPRSVLFATRDPKELEKIPRSDVTNLPPIPKSSRPAPELRLPPSEAEAPVVSSKPAAPKGTSRLKPPPPSEILAEENGAEPVFPIAPDPPREDQIPRAGSEGKTSPDFPIPGSPGLPFAKDTLNQFAKLFSEEDREKKASKDPITVNTKDLSYYSYGLQVLNKIETVWRYPEQAARTGIGGEVVVDMMIRRSGDLADIVLLQSSGHRLLDEEVFRSVRRAAPYSPLPSGLVEDPFPMTIHFLYLNHSLFYYRTR